MSKLAYSVVTIATIALMASTATSGMVRAMPDSEWSVPMTADAGVEGSNAELEFGIDPDGTDGYDSDIDSLSPPPGPGALFEAYFSIVDDLFPRLTEDFRAQTPNQWTLEMRSTDENIELSWDTTDVPQAVALKLINTEVDIDMKAVNVVTLPPGAHTVTIVAEQIERMQYDLTIFSTDGGSVTVPGEGTSAYDEGTLVTLVAEADEGYRFISWTGDADTVANVNAASTTVTMNDNYYVIANFEVLPPGQYSLGISSTAGGSVKIPGESVFIYDEGTTVGLVGEAHEGYRFIGWTGDVNTIANVNAASTTITVDDDYEITANFEEISSSPPTSTSYALAVSSTGGGSVSTPGEATFKYDGGAVVELVAEAEEGHQFVTWTGDVETIADIEAASTTISIQGNYTIMADFDEIPPPINWSLIGGIVAAVIAVGPAVFLFRRRRVT